MKTSEGARFGIGFKLVLGLGTLIGISVVVGLMAVTSLLSIQENSSDLSEQYLPESRLATEVERQILHLVLEVRGYWLSMDQKYFVDASKELGDLKNSLTDIGLLLDKSPKLSKLRLTLPKAIAAQALYSELLAKTKTATDAILKDRLEMDATVRLFQDAADAYLSNENSALLSDIRSGVKPADLAVRIGRMTAGNQILAWGNEVQVAYFKSQTLRDPSHLQAVQGNFQKIADQVQSLLRVTTRQINRDQLADILSSTAEYKNTTTVWLAEDELLSTLAVQRDSAKETLILLAQETSQDGIQTSLDLAVANSAIVGTANAAILTGLIVSLLLGLLVALLLIRSITRPLSLVTALSRKVAMGDFSIERSPVKNRDELGLLIESFYDMVEGLKAKAVLIENIANGVMTNTIILAGEDDGLGRSLQRMQASLNEILTQVNVAIDQMAGGSDQVSTASQSLSQGATEQASSLEEISASANQIHGQSKQNAENATTANQLAKQAARSAQQGNQQMKDLMGLLAKMTKSSEETKSIVKTIDDIAFQVNLLALNANVEAARAGKYGKGFAVVAEEVRNLAVRSATAVNETTRMVEESIQNIQDVNATALKTGDQLNGILGNANKVADFLEEIAASSQEQARSMGQINTGLDQIDQVTQSNTSSAEESASASEELSGQAQQLKVMISRFQLSDEALLRARSQASIGNHRRSAPPPVTGQSAPVNRSSPRALAPSLLRKASLSPAQPRAPAKDIILNEDFDTF